MVLMKVKQVHGSALHESRLESFNQPRRRPSPRAPRSAGQGYFKHTSVGSGVGGWGEGRLSAGLIGQSASWDQSRPRLLASGPEGLTEVLAALPCVEASLTLRLTILWPACGRVSSRSETSACGSPRSPLLAGTASLLHVLRVGPAFPGSPQAWQTGPGAPQG